MIYYNNVSSLVLTMVRMFMIKRGHNVTSRKIQPLMLVFVGLGVEVSFLGLLYNEMSQNEVSSHHEHY